MKVESSFVTIGMVDVSVAGVSEWKTLDSCPAQAGLRDETSEEWWSRE